MADSTIFQRRYSCRAYTSKKVPRSTLERLLEAAILAPNAGNIQPWRFVVVSKANLRRALVSAANGQLPVAQAPVIIVVCALTLACSHNYGRRGRQLYCIQDTAAACQNLLLAAAAEGLGSCWVGAFDEGLVKGTLKLHESWRPVALVTVGHAAEKQPERQRHPLDDVVSWLD